MIPTHHARAIQIWFPTVAEFSSERIDSTIDVTGLFSANIRTAAGIVSVGTKAELRKGRKSSRYENEDAPSYIRCIAAAHVYILESSRSCVFAVESNNYFSLSDISIFAFNTLTLGSPNTPSALSSVHLSTILLSSSLLIPVASDIAGICISAALGLI